MKIAEALMLRSDLQKQLASLKHRIETNAKAKAGGSPSENPKKLLEQFNHIADEVQSLIQSINRTNSKTAFDERSSLADALAVRESLKLRCGLYNTLANAATVRAERTYYRDGECELVGTVDVSTMYSEASKLAQQYRDYDLRIQFLNWQVDLFDSPDPQVI